MNTPLLSICDIIVDCEHKTAQISTCGYPSIRTPNVGRGRLILEGVNRIDEETYLYWTKRAIPSPGDIIIAREAPIGNVAIIMPGQLVCLGQRTVLVRANPKIVDPRYLTYFLLGKYAQNYFHSCSIGATVPHLNMKDIRSLPIPKLPALDVQRRIADILSAYDDLVEVNTRRIAILEEIARRLFDDWIIEYRFPASEGVSPGCSRKASLHDLVEDIRDPILPSQAASDTPYVGLEHMPRHSTTLTSIGKVDQVDSTKLKFISGDILFGKIRPYFHKVVHAACSGVTSSDSIVMRPRCAEFRPLALCLVSSDAFVAHAVQTSNGTKMPRANWNVLKNYPIIIPPEIVLNRFASIVGAAIELCSTLAGSSRNLQGTRDLLLRRLISGKINASAAGRVIEQFTGQAAAK